MMISTEQAQTDAAIDAADCQGNYLMEISHRCWRNWKTDNRTKIK